MTSPMDNFRARLFYGLSALDGKLEKKTSFSDWFKPTDELLEGMNQDRVNLYWQIVQAITTGNSDVVGRTLDIDKMTHHERQVKKDIMEKIAKRLLGVTAINPDIDVTAKKAGGAQAGGAQEGGAYWKDLYDKIMAVENGTDVTDKNQALRQLAKDNANHPIFSPDTLKTTMADRIIFIAFTFALRSFSLTLTQWALTTRMVNTFEYAIVFYVFVYLMFFALWVLIVNISDKDLFLHMIFYYVNTEGDRGTYRIWLHTLIQFMLVPVPFVLRTRNDDKNPKLSVEDQIRAMNMVGKLSFVLWALGAFIALRF
jgi:hypothetical protein